MPKKSLVPDYIRNLVPYKAGKPIEELSREKGIEKISKLASNENPLGPSPYAIKEMTQGLWDLHSYPDMYAYNLKASLCKLYDLKPENIILGNGSEGIMAYIARTFVLPGDHIVTSENTFIGFNILFQSVGANIERTPLTEDYKFDIIKIAEAIKPDTKIIYIANPNNPTGTYVSKTEFDFLMKHVPKHTLVILDEAYFEFAKNLEDYPDSMDYRYDNVITLRTFSKAYGLAGIRVGYGFAHEDLIANLTKIKLPFEPNLIAQLGAIGALRDKPHLKRTLKNNRKMKAKTEEFFKDHGIIYIPSVTNFLTFKVNSEASAEKLNTLLLERGVIVRPLKSNGLDSFIRLSIGNKDEMNHFFESMLEVMPEIKSIF